MNTVIVGHRGTGKTRFLQRLKGYFEARGRAVRTCDLDDFIAGKERLDIGGLIARKGERGFRSLERRYFSDIRKRADSHPEPCFVAAGAGWLGPPPKHWDCLWLRRATDVRGRIFLDRPRLDPGLTPLAEYRKRFAVRERRYRAWSRSVLEIPEGMDCPNPFEESWVFDGMKDVGGVLTLVPGHLREEEDMAAWLERRWRWGVRFVELRDDLLPADGLRRALQCGPEDRFLVSFRDRAREGETRRAIGGSAVRWDWPVERGQCPFGPPSVLSMHERPRGASLQERLGLLERQDDGAAVLKAALPVFNFDELLAGERWHRRDPSRRVFLPVSKDGRWAWYRLLKKGRHWLNFFRDREGSAADQPTLLEWMMAPEKPEAFAAVLGSPITHSRSPAEHRRFFLKKDIPIFAVRVDAADWNGGALDVLRELGLSYAAITSPLKPLAYERARRRSREAEKVRSINTLRWDPGRSEWTGTNTDLQGLGALLSGLKRLRLAVWGGGGTLEAIRRRVPHAVFYSARSGRIREGIGVGKRRSWDGGKGPEVVLWAAGSRHDGDAVKQPPASWRPLRVIDLDYAEDSSGREYSLRVGAAYLSGMRLFDVQAEGQRRFWDEPLS